MQKHYTTKAKREALAKSVSEVLALFMGEGEALTPCKLYPDEWEYRREGFETARGRVSHLSVRTCPYGLSVHIKFSAPQFAPPGAGVSGKWNHYTWTSDMEAIQGEIARILYDVRPNGQVRYDRPNMSGYWIAQREAFAAKGEERSHDKN